MASQCDNTTCTAHEGRECSNLYSPYRVTRITREHDICRPCASDIVLFGLFTVLHNTQERKS